MELSTNINSFIADINRADKAVKRATVTALNWTAFDAREDLQDEMRRVFDNPTPWTINSVFVKKATQRTYQAAVGIKNTSLSGAPAAEYLRTHVEGGDRTVKRFERLLRKSGVLKGNQRVVAAGAARKNKYGNITKARLSRIIKDVRNGRKAGATYFTMRKGNAPIGIFQRKNSKTLVAEFGIVNGTMHYRDVLNMSGVVLSTRDRKFKGAYQRALRRELSN